VIVSLILSAGCTGYPTVKTADAKNSPQSGSLNLSSGGNDPSALVGPWYVKALVIEGTPKVPVRLTGIQLTFQNNGSFSGYDSCNPYAGLWQADKTNNNKVDISR
jgi:heat shock protein HslJ